MPPSALESPSQISPADKPSGLRIEGSFSDVTALSKCPLRWRQRRLWLTPDYETEVLAAQALQRLIEPEEVARLILFLAADDSSAITNQSHVIDGGWV